MKNIIEEIRKMYYVDGEASGEEKYLETYDSREDLEEEVGIESFESQFDVSVDEMQFPIITFDFSGASDGWAFDGNSDKEDIMNRADQYFTKK